MNTGKTPVRQGPQPPKTLLEFFGLVLKQMPKNLLKQIPWMILIAGFTWVFHTFLLVFINEGFDVTGASVWIKAALSGNGSQSGILFWTLMGGIASFGFAQLRQNGISKTINAAVSTPGWMFSSFKNFSMSRLPLLLGGGAAGFLLLSIVNSPLYAVQLALMLLGEWMAQGKGLLGIILPLGWSDAQRLFKRGLPPAPFGTGWLGLILTGLSLSAFLGLFFPAWLMVCNLLLAVIVIVALTLLNSNKTVPRGTALLLAALAGLGLLALRLNGIVLADDGGWQEAGGTFGSWVVSEGAGLAVGFGFPPSFGAGLGWLIGSVMPGLINFPTAAPEISTVPDWIKDPEVSDAIKAWQREIDKAQKEADDYQKLWDDVKDSYDKNDPNYEKLRDQYTQYINSQRQTAEQAKNQIDKLINDEAKYQQEQRYIDAYAQHREAEKDFIDAQREKLENRDTAFDRDMDKFVAAQNEKAEALDRLQKIRNQALDKGLGTDHGPGDVIDKADEMINNLLDGKEITKADIDKVAKVVKDRVSGSSAKEGDAYIPSNMDIAAETVIGSIRTAFTGTNPDGSTNWVAVGTRVGVGMYTLGTSEWVYTPVNSAYTAKDAIDRGASDSEAIVGGLVRAGTDVVIGKLFVGGLSLTGKAIKYVLPGTSKAVGKLVTNVAGKLTKAFQGAPKPQPIPTARLDSVNRALQNALRKGDEKALLNLYKNGGMKEIGKLEQLGHVSPEAAKQLNTALTKTVNRAIDTGTGRAINTFQKNTGVGIRRVNVGDSGSSAKGGTRSVTTDFDRTTVPEFEPKSLNDYAKRNGLTPAEAEKQLKKEFCDNHFSTQVDDALKETGLPGGAKDVDFKGYDGIGAKAGPSDSYSYGYTSRRQAIGGKTKVYVPDKDGGVRSYETSGQATVDADGLSKGRVEGALPDAPGKVPPGELPGVIKEQIKSAAKHDDVKSLAKALGRTGEAADTLGIHNPDLDKLRDITQQINKNPQQMDTILQNNGMTPKDYIQSTRSIIKEIDNVASQLEF